MTFAPVTSDEPKPMSVRDESLAILSRLGTPESAFAASGLGVASPITGETVTHVRVTEPQEAGAAIGRAARAFATWRTVPAPRRGELVRLLGEELRAAKADLGRLVTLEAGKIVSEGARRSPGDDRHLRLRGRAVAPALWPAPSPPSGRDHRMMETWHPLGVVGVITAFNFPVAVWAWNAALALVCGDPVVWKPSEKTPLTALAVQALVRARHAAVRRCARRAVRAC